MQAIFKPLLGLALAMTLATSAFAAEPGKERSHRHNPLERMQTKLNLSADQVSRLQPAFEAAKQRHMAQREAFKAKMDSILTADQKAQWEKSKGDGGRKRGGFKALNLTADQKAQLKTYWEQNRSQGQAQRKEMETQLMAVLTPEQQTKLKEMKSKHQGRHGHRGHRGHHQGGDNQDNK